MLLYAVGAAVIGGTSLFGGKGRAIDAVIGGVVVATIANGLGLLNQSSYINFLVTGGVLLLAASVDAISRRRRSSTGLYCELVTSLSDEETFLIQTVREFVDREVKPSVQEVEHSGAYPERWIEQMKQIGIYGLAVPEAYGGSPVSMPCYAQGHPGTRARMDESGRCDGWAHRGRQAAHPLRHRGTAADLPATDGHRRGPGHHGTHRTRRRLRSAGHDAPSPEDRRRGPG